MLDIIFRSCSRPEAQVHGNTRIVPKPECVIKCLKSIVTNLSFFPDIRRVTVIDDHSDPEVVEQLQRLSTKFIAMQETGNGESLAACYDFADKECQDLIYFVEDDYLHEPGSLLEMLHAYHDFSKNLGGREVAIFPLDCNDRYKPDMMYPSFIVPGEKRYWRTVQHTTGTVMLHKNSFERYRHLFQQFTLYGKDPRIHESTTINHIWRDPNGVICFSPIPTLAYHLQLKEHLPLYTDYRPLWESLC
jgi:glycosyltransferase involved in cell wall biosynthesis